MGAQHHAPAALLLWKSLGTLVQKDWCAEQVTVQPVATLDTSRPYECHRMFGSCTQQPTAGALRLVWTAVNVLSEDPEKTAKLSEMLSLADIIFTAKAVHLSLDLVRFLPHP